MLSKMKQCFPIQTDSYKIGHWQFLLPGTTGSTSYMESRPGAKYPYTVMYSLYYYLLEYFEGVRVTKKDIKKAVRICKSHFGKDIFNHKMWNHIVDNCGGKLPLLIKSMPEGTPVPNGVAMFTIESTDDLCAPLVQHCETILMRVFHGSAVATKSRLLKTVIKDALEKSSCGPIDLILSFSLHDFGYRSTKGEEAAMVAASAHALNFRGSDTLPVLQFMEDYYDLDIENGVKSVDATEHSIATQGGEYMESEVTGLVFDKTPTGILSLVADSFNIENFVKNIIGDTYKDRVLSRDGKTVIRPDSTHPDYPTPGKQLVWLAELLADSFGYTINEKSYKVLHPSVGLIFGDGLTDDDIKELYTYLIEQGWSADNVVVGQGGRLLDSSHNRDTQRSAIKCSAVERFDEWCDVYKKPSNCAWKNSKRGRLKNIILDGELKTVRIDEYPELEDQLVEIFRDGVVVKHYTVADMEANIAL
jgi:nicotinamide phosphoribosyltransferase